LPKFDISAIPVTLCSILIAIHFGGDIVNSISQALGTCIEGREAFVLLFEYFLERFEFVIDVLLHFLEL
jgi:hypothetical protein